MVEVGEAEKEVGVMAKDEEKKAEAGEVMMEEGERHQCDQCGKSYVFKHKLAHHKTWLCKEAAPTIVEVEPRRKLSSNVFHLPTIPEREEGGEVSGVRDGRVEMEGKKGISLQEREEEVEVGESQRESEESGGAEVSGPVEPEVCECDH